MLQPEQKVHSFHLHAQSCTTCNSHFLPAADFDVLLQYECENVLNDAALMEAAKAALRRTLGRRLQKRPLVDVHLLRV